jgi:predicted nucleic acid-binding protein
LAKISALHILRQLYFEILIPEAVYNELCQAKRTQPGALQVLNAPWIKVVQIKNNALSNRLIQRLHLGESEAIALAVETNADVLIIDEIAGRTVAKKLGRKIIGMIGVLLEAKKSGIISSVRPYLNNLKNTGFRMSQDLYDLALSQAGEDSIESVSR